MSAIGRNDPCPCGSGKKYKRCCLEKDARVTEELEVLTIVAGRLEAAGIAYMVTDRSQPTTTRCHA